MTAPPTPPSGGSGRVQVVNLLPVAFAVLAAFLLLGFFGQVAGPLLATTLAVIVAAALNPAVRFFERWLPRGVSALLTVLLALGALGGLLWLVLPAIVGQIGDLIADLPTDLESLQANWDALAVQLGLPGLQGLSLEDNLSEVINWGAGSLSSLMGLGGQLIGALFLGVFALVMVVFALANPTPLIAGVLGAFPPSYRPQATRALAQILMQVGAWGRATLVLMILVGAAMSAGLYLLGVENPLVFGLLSAIGELVPNVGPIVAAIPPIAAAYLNDPQTALYVAVFAFALQQVESYVIAPLLLGRAAKLHPLSVTLGVLLFGSVFGLIGAFLTVPLLIVIRAVYEHFYLIERPEISDEVALALLRGDVEEDLQRQQRMQERRHELERRRAALREERGEELSLEDLEQLAADPADPSGAAAPSAAAPGAAAPGAAAPGAAATPSGDPKGAPPPPRDPRA